MANTNRIAPDERPSLPNGHLPENGNTRMDGHAAESRTIAPVDSGPAAKVPIKRHRARAASDDAHEAPSATAAAPAPASTVRDASAEVARASKDEKGCETRRERRSGSSANTEPPLPLPPGKLPLPEDAAAFVSAVHEQADIIEVGRRLLNSKDEKIIKGVWDRLVNLKFGNTDQAPDTTSEGMSIEGAPRPDRDP